MMGRKNLAIVYPNKSSSSETFIKAHVDYLPFRVRTLYGGWFLVFSDGDRILKPGLFHRVISKVSREVSTRLLRIPLSEPPYKSASRTSFLRFLKRNSIDAVLAEYGLTGVEIMDVCAQAKIPLIVHFHGFDAYHYDTVKKYRAGY